MPPRWRDAVWSAAEAAGSGGMSLLSALAVARIIGPTEFGVAAAIVGVHVLLWIAATALFADALVQRRVLAPGDAAGAAWASAGLGLVAAAAQAAAGAALVAWLRDPRLAAMGWALALPLPLVGAAGAAQGMLTRARRYRTLALRTLIGQGAGVACGLAAAWAGAGAWALVGQQAVLSGVGAAVAVAAAAPALRGRPRWRPVAAMLRLGVPLTLATLCQAARYRAFALLVGGVAGAATLGQLHLAFRLVETLRELANAALWRLLLPRFAPAQDDLPRLRALLDRAVSCVAPAALLALGVAGLCLGPLVLSVLGPAWRPATLAALPLVAVAAVDLLGYPGTAAMIARGRAGATLLCQGVAMALTLALGSALPPASPLAAAWIWLAASLAATALLWRLVGRALQAGPLRHLRAAGPALLADAAGAGAAAWLPAGTGTLAASAPRPVLFAGAFLVAWLASRRRALPAADPAGWRRTAATRATAALRQAA